MYDCKYYGTLTFSPNYPPLLGNIAWNRNKWQRGRESPKLRRQRVIAHVVFNGLLSVSTNTFPNNNGQKRIIRRYGGSNTWGGDDLLERNMRARSNLLPLFNKHTSKIFHPSFFWARSVSFGAASCFPLLWHPSISKEYRGTWRGTTTSFSHTRRFPPWRWGWLGEKNETVSWKVIPWKQYTSKQMGW